MIKGGIWADPSSSDQFDQSSVEGKFSWLDVQDRQCVPQLSRVEHGVRSNYVSVKMMMMTLLETSTFKALPQGVAVLPELFKVTPSVNEMKLLADINKNHCDCQYGRADTFSNDFLVKDKDVFQYRHYLIFCYNKLFSHESDIDLRCGLMRGACPESQEMEVAFVRVAGTRYIPLFYLEGETEGLTWTRLSGWDWLYLKFSCLVQGVREATKVVK